MTPGFRVASEGARAVPTAKVGWEDSLLFDFPTTQTRLREPTRALAKPRLSEGADLASPRHHEMDVPQKVVGELPAGDAGSRWARSTAEPRLTVKCSRIRS